MPGFGEESVDACEAACRSLGPTIGEGASAGLPQGLATLRHALASAIPGHPGRAQHASLAVAALLPSGRSAVEEGPVKADAGFRVFKWKVGVGAADDEQAILDDLIGGLPSGSRIRLDANGAWNRRAAERWLDLAADRPVEFVEQPVDARGKGAEDLLLGLAGDFPVRIALDESLVNDGDVDRWLGLGWPGYYVIKPSLLGDAGATVEKLSKAAADVVFSSALETAVGAQAALRLAFAWKGKLSALGFGVWPLFDEPTFDGPAAAPFIRAEDVERMDPQLLWNALD